jgi:hypothetical protein
MIRNICTHTLDIHGTVQGSRASYRRDIQDECRAGSNAGVAGAELMRKRLKGLKGERMQNKITRALKGTTNKLQLYAYTVHEIRGFRENVHGFSLTCFH